MAKIVYNALLGGFYVVRGPHQTPLSGRFATRADAAAWLAADPGSRPAAPRIEPGDWFHPIGRPVPVYQYDREYLFQGRRRICGHYLHAGQQRIGIDLPESELVKVIRRD